MAYWVQNDAGLKLATMSRPRGGDWLLSEMSALKREGADVLVSLLTYAEIEELELGTEAQACAAAGIDYRCFAIPDREVPESSSSFNAFVDEIFEHASIGAAVVAHCRAGIGRSSLLIAALLIKGGLTANQAFEGISQARGLHVPDTEEQRVWLDQYLRTTESATQASLDELG